MIKCKTRNNKAPITRYIISFKAEGEPIIYCTLPIASAFPKVKY